MSSTPTWDCLRAKLTDMTEGYAIQVAQSEMNKAFEEIDQHDLPTGFGVSHNDILALSGQRTVPLPEDQLKQLCREYGVHIQEPLQHEHWLFIKGEKSR